MDEDGKGGGSAVPDPRRAVVNDAKALFYVWWDDKDIEEFYRVRC
jgi:hypothetical protein